MIFFVLIIDLVVTLLVYGVFPVIFAKTRKTPISKKKYKGLCYAVNIIGLIFFIVINGAASGGPYILWTWIFSKYGIKTLDAKKLLATDVKESDIDDIELEVDKYEKNESSPNKDECPCCFSKINDKDKECPHCGYKLK